MFIKRHHTSDILQWHNHILRKHSPEIIHPTKKLDLKEFMATITSGSVISVKYGAEKFHGALIQTRNKGIDSSIHIRQSNFYNTAVERMYKVHDPKLSEIKIIKVANWSRRAKLYFIRDSPNKQKSGYK